MSCSTSHVTSEVSSDRFQVSGEREARDSLCEEISQNLNENLTEHEVVTETFFRNDSVKLERITDRTTVRGRTARTEAKKDEVRIVRDTVYIEHRDSVFVKNTNLTNPTDKKPGGFVTTLKWIFYIIIGLIALIIAIKVCLRRI